MIRREPWDSTRAQLFEGLAVSVLVSPRRCRRPGMSDVWITMVAKPGGPRQLGPAAVTLAGTRRSQYGRLDARGRCLIRDVPDGQYRLGLCRVPELTDPQIAAILPVPAECLDSSSSWTSGDGRLTARRLSEDWRTIQVEAAGTTGESADLQVGRVVDGRLELRRVHLDARPVGGRRTATLRFDTPGAPAVVCLPLPGTER
jgi:hypothetical protein